MAKSHIEWTEETWNPTTGCNKISAGCKFCYAEVLSHRLQAMKQQKYKNGFQLTLHEAELNRPYTWKEPKIVFVNSMSDLFHEDVPIEFIQRVFKVMNDTPQHTYQVLTKRADRLHEVYRELTWTDNIWMGVSVEDEKVKERIDLLRGTNAQTKFLSCEPLIGPLPDLNLAGIDWVIAGGESGPGARLVKPEWVLDIKDQCKAASVAFFFKQWGMKKFNPDPSDPTISSKHEHHAKGGCLLAGKLFREMPTPMLQVI
jgi:protein gp37